MQMPIMIVQMSMSDVFAVLASLSTTPDSLSKFPKKSIPSSIDPAGAIKDVAMKAMIGNSIFSLFETSRGVFILMTRSLSVVNNLITGG
jgi:hypothetical protein